KRAQLVLDHRQETAELVRVAPKVLGGARPEGHRRDAEVDAPGQHLVELRRSDPVGVHRIPTLRPSPPSVPVEDDADVARQGPPGELGLEPPRVEPVEEPAPARLAAHRPCHSLGRRAIRSLYSDSWTTSPCWLTICRCSTTTPLSFMGRLPDTLTRQWIVSPMRTGWRRARSNTSVSV